MSAFVVPLEQIAALTKGTLMGRPDLVITGVAGLSEASPGDLSFVAGEAASSESTSTRAAALLVPRPIDGLGCAQIVVPNPALAMAQVVEKFFVPRSEEHTSELQSRLHLVCRLLLEKKKKKTDSLLYRCRRTIRSAY